MQYSYSRYYTIEQPLPLLKLHRQVAPRRGVHTSSAPRRLARLWEALSDVLDWGTPRARTGGSGADHQAYMTLVSTRRIQKSCKSKVTCIAFHICSVNWQDTNIILYTIDGVRINKYRTWRWCTFIYKPQEHVNFWSNGSFEISLNHPPCSLATKCGQDNNNRNTNHTVSSWNHHLVSFGDLPLRQFLT